MPIYVRKIRFCRVDIHETGTGKPFVRIERSREFTSQEFMLPLKERPAMIGQAQRTADTDMAKAVLPRCETVIRGLLERGMAAEQEMEKGPYVP